MENFIEMIVDSIVPIAIILLVLWAEYRKRAKKDESRQVAAPLSRAAVADAPSHTPTHTKPVSKPQRHLPVEGECAIPDYHPEPESEPTATSADTAELEAHYSRWRQALIDREVLETKF
ncbi:MAG: hypothetical protein J1E29_01865 [Duncaniella sp.]|nr:hypothetical protein [Duncaniella sp.]